MNHKSNGSRTVELDSILVQGARQHNLRIDHLAIPKKKLVVFTGVSGSGKSSLAFDTLYAEGQRRYVESLSSYARQFLGQMDKPQVERIKGLSPTIAIEQKTASSNPRSTVGTITEVYDYLRVLYARIGVQHCPKCDKAVAALSVDQIVSEVQALSGMTMLLAPIAENRKGEFKDVLEGLRQRGFARVRVDGEVRSLDEDLRIDKKARHTLELVVDRIAPERTSRARLADSVESALREGKGMMVCVSPDAGERRFSQLRACSTCGIGMPELSPQSFSFNTPLGMCPSCNGLGRQEEMDPALVAPDSTLSIRQGALVPWASVMARGAGISFGMFDALARQVGIDLDTPWRKLPAAQQKIVLYGMGDQALQVKWKGRHGHVAWAMQWEGVLPMLMRRYRETKSEQMRQYYQQYISEAPCHACGGARLRPESRAVRVAGHRIEEVAELPISAACDHFRDLRLGKQDAAVAAEVLREILARLEFLRSVGLDYLTLSRLGPSLSGGEAQRIRLASQLGSELSGVLYVLDEPSIGLHQRDNRRLIDTLVRLRDLGNTVIVVEHDRETIESADHVVDFGPGAGELGGKVVFSGTPTDLRHSDSLTGRYLRGDACIPVPAKRRGATSELLVRGARENNLKGIDVRFPLGTLTAVTGVSGAGKSSLVTAILYPALCRKLHDSKVAVGAHDAIVGLEAIDKAIHIDQAPIGRTPRSNPATYTKSFDLIRDLFSMTPEARAQGYDPGRFSFNVKGGRCEACEGDGVIRVEMHFLPDVYVPCEVCRGKRYNEATLGVHFKGLNIADVLGLSVREAIEVFGAQPKLKRILKTLSQVGLDYVKLGQPAPTLSGGEAQRVKLSRELARKDTGRTLYVLDEPTTGLHFDDIRKLLDVLHRLVEAGNTVIVIEHNLDVIKCADHVIDLGPEGGERGGKVVATGTPEQVASHAASTTGKYLRKVL
ncbi:MAG: excinuclease ABC subunit UvrA [Deltaproteobacteria bacterium]|nr:excinuclease ABC subunit UvrA [Deltaproteobacteria bacterium]